MQAVQEAQLLSTEQGWVLRPDAIFFTTDAGDRWQRIPLPNAENGIHAAAVVDTERAWVATVIPSGIQVDHTDDAGATWGQVVLKPVGEPGALSLAFDGNVGGLLVTHVTSSNFSSAELFSTADGLTWNRHDAPVAGAFTLVRPTTFLLAGGARGDELWRSSDLGQTWSRLSLVPPPASPHTVEAPQMTSPSAGILPVTVGGDAETSVFFYSTEDGGRTWNRSGVIKVSAGTGNGVGLPVATFGEGMWSVMTPSGEHLYVTVDGGKTFRATEATGLPEGIAEIDFADANLGWARTETVSCAPGKIDCSTSTGLYETTNGGASWSQLAVP
jgi:photosystem II stability/assembly factor-like uncharacterized protein